jgi:uncharacterized protein (AIM24 family)
MDRIACSWCQFQNDQERVSCSTCGAPLDVTKVVSDSGWREAPRLREMTEFGVGTCTCQIAGGFVPVAEFTLAEDDMVFFEQHTLLWKERTVSLTGKALTGSTKRLAGGMPYAVIEARGPGRIAFTRDASGEVVALPLHPQAELDVRGHAFLVASQSVTYDFIRITGLVNVLHGGEGMYLDRFVSRGAPGLLLLHGNGNVFQRQLAEGEKIQVEPGGFLYKDSSVAMSTIKLQVGASLGHKNAYLAELTGPGRVGIQSMYVHVHTD